MFQLAYCLPVVSDESKMLEYENVCQNFVDTCAECMPEFSKRSKVHMLLHLVKDIIDFGPVSCFCTERLVNLSYMHVNGIISLHYK